MMRMLRAALLVAGTAIGAGMLALPVATALGGFVPACVLYLICWVLMAGTGLLLLELCLWMPKNANMVTMALRILGPKGRILSWLLYLFLFYCLTIAYTAGGGKLVSEISLGMVNEEIGILLFVLIFAPVVYWGTAAVDKMNLFLMLGLGIAYLAFVLIGWQYVDLALLERRDWSAAFLSLPVVFTSFSFQGIVPSLTAYMQKDAPMIRKAIWVGTGIPFIVYVLWEFLILGIIPLEGENGLLAAKAAGLPAVIPLKGVVLSPYVYFWGQAFAFFALTTSFIGVTLGLIDFLEDGLQLSRQRRLRSLLCLGVFVPPLAIALSNPSIFIKALTYAGGIGCALLLGLLPIVMVWKGRYAQGYIGERQLKGGKITLAFLLMLVVSEVALELFTEFFV